jgi:hypothetical protein
MRALRSSHHASSGVSARRFTFDGIPPNGDGESTSGGASLALRLNVFVTRRKLDRRIAAGRPCESSPALALRAHQLTGSRSREEIARNLRGVVDYVHRHRSRSVISAVVIEPAAVRSGRRAILELARRLEGTAPVSPGGVVRAGALLTDGRSPLFNPHCERTVAQAVSEVHDALEGLPVVEFDALAA